MKKKAVKKDAPRDELKDVPKDVRTDEPKVELRDVLKGLPKGKQKAR